MRGFVNNMGLLDWKLAMFSLQFGSSHEGFLYEKLTKKFKKNTFRLAAFYLDTVLFTWIMLYLRFSFVSACLMQPAFQTVQVIKKRNKNTEWMFSLGVFLNFKKCISAHTLQTCSLFMCQKRVGWAACMETGGAHAHDRCAPHMGSRDGYMAD